MDLKKKLNFEMDDELFDYKLFDTLKAINKTHSQRKASKSLNISHSVLNRRILKAENLLGKDLVRVSNRGSLLTDYAKELLEEYETYEYRLEDEDIVTIVGGPISCEFLRQLSMSYNLETRIIQTDNQTAVKLTNMGLVDVLAFDDPVKAYMMNLEPIPLARDSLVLLSSKEEEFNSVRDLDSLNFVEVDNSAQRLAWTTLVDYDLNFNISTYVNSFHEAIKIVEQEEDMYTFINKSMSYRCQYTYDIISTQTQHILSALNVKNDTLVDNFLNFASHKAEKLTKKYGFKPI